MDQTQSPVEKANEMRRNIKQGQNVTFSHGLDENKNVENVQGASDRTIWIGNGIQVQDSMIFLHHSRFLFLCLSTEIFINVRPPRTAYDHATVALSGTWIDNSRRDSRQFGQKLRHYGRSVLRASDILSNPIFVHQVSLLWGLPISRYFEYSILYPLIILRCRQKF